MKTQRSSEWLGRAGVVAGALCCFAACAAEPELIIGARKDAPSAASSQREWFKSGLGESAYQTETYAAAKQLANEKLEATERAAIQEGLSRDKERSIKACLWLMDWNNCADPVGRVGAVNGLGTLSYDSKKLGKQIASSAIFDPDEKVRKATAAMIKSRKDLAAEREVLETWKTSFDESGVLDVNETRRKASVAAMREIGDKQIFQALVWYAQLELRAGSAQTVRVDTVNIRGQGINLPIDLPVLDLVSAQGNIVVPAMTSLKQATGQDFGRNFGKWNEWIAKLP